MLAEISSYSKHCNLVTQSPRKVAHFMSIPIFDKVNTLRFFKLPVKSDIYSSILETAMGKALDGLGSFKMNLVNDAVALEGRRTFEMVP